MEDLDGNLHRSSAKAWANTVADGSLDTMNENISSPCSEIYVNQNELNDQHFSPSQVNSLFSTPWQLGEPPLIFDLIEKDGRARCGRMRLPHGIVDTPIFMPVGTHGAIKGLTSGQVESLGCTIMLSNTYHLANRPGPTILEKAKGLHTFMGWSRNLLTDSGGFQMVSLLNLAEITEEGVTFASPVDGSKMLMTPEKSIETQNIIGADIIMALDDVVSSTHPHKERVEEATYRTTRWLDRCIRAHARSNDQVLFGIVQGGLHKDLRQISLDNLIKRNLYGYAIGGVSGGEAKESFWKVIDQVWKGVYAKMEDISSSTMQSTQPVTGLPFEKPRYVMGVGYPLDIVVCVALGCDMFDCVYPCRTARFGTALTNKGPLRVKLQRYSMDHRSIDENCRCYTCSNYTRSFLHNSIGKTPAASHLMTLHNIHYMMDLCQRMRIAIREKKFEAFVRSFLREYFGCFELSEYSTEGDSTIAASSTQNRSNEGLSNESKVDMSNGNDRSRSTKNTIPAWVHDALLEAGIDISDMLVSV
ncbi:queuine trna-ribosyltransferase domain-containing protein [Cardiosporidium cionae]|uniref:Queuine tRNA-ribosyltransferase catalytic subunit 1 n=1 Tax=Cardiosporidium cionae TaxID=476202 RepID=A0ABQ7JCS0_9APIC|nr:queuine trna-ribosyltransferase domain-containing protein [Cardiosporidium cionae]|eukprot:KAF8821776.1 queuine trna-ribosyltransferase domain-containing protein [Cardiosporidium cionae]